MKCMPGFVKVSFFYTQEILAENISEFAWELSTPTHSPKINISGNRSNHFKMTNDGIRLEFTIMSPDKL